MFSSATYSIAASFLKWGLDITLSSIFAPCAFSILDLNQIFLVPWVFFSVLSQMKSLTSVGAVDISFSWEWGEGIPLFFPPASTLLWAAAWPSQGLGAASHPLSWTGLVSNVPSSSGIASLLYFILLATCSCPLSCFLCHWVYTLKMSFFIVTAMPSWEGCYSRG